MNWDQKYEVPSLDEFTVTEKKATVDLPKMSFETWLAAIPWTDRPDYDFENDILYIGASKPIDVEVSYRHFTLIWNNEPGWRIP